MDSISFGDFVDFITIIGIGITHCFGSDLDLSSVLLLLSKEIVSPKTTAKTATLVLPQEDKQDDGYKDYLKTVKVERPVSTPAVTVPVSTDVPTYPEYVNRGEYYSTQRKAYNAANRDGGGREPMLHPPHSWLGSHHYHVHGHEIINGVNMHYNFIP